jgi:hypothetical protein
MVRLRVETHALLLAIRDRMVTAYQEGKRSLPDDQADRLSLDFVVGELIRQRLSHARRRAKGRKKN